MTLPWLAQAQSYAAKSEAGIRDHAPEATRFYVAITGTGAGGSDWVNAFKNLQDALVDASDPTIHPVEIWVAKGIYYPDIGSGQINNERSSTFVMTDGVSLIGGFTFGDSEVTDRDPKSNITVLSGDIDWDNGGADVTDPNGVVITTTNIIGDNAYHVVSAKWVSGTAVLDGFTITGGKADGSFPNHVGGGFYCDGVGSGKVCNPRLTNVTFSGNLAGFGGGAMYNNGSPNGESNPSLANVTFSGNSAANHGGAMYNHGSFGTSNPLLSNVTFSGNSAIYDGGAMFNNGINSGESNPGLVNVVFSGNNAEYGGAMYNDGSYSGDSSPKMTNITFSGNSAFVGGAMFNSGFNGKTIPEVYNSVLWNNMANGVTGTAAANVINESGATITFTHSLVEGVYAGGGWIGGTYIDGGGNIDVEPLFLDPISLSSAPTTTGNLRLGEGSPAIEAGLNIHTENTGVLTDLDGEVRFKDGDGDGDAVVDMGAYEAQTRYLLSVSKTGTGNGKVTSTPANINCGATCSAAVKEDSTINLTTTADVGSLFAGWSGDCSGDGDCLLTMDGAKDVTAKFDLEPAYEINLPLAFR